MLLFGQYVVDPIQINILYPFSSLGLNISFICYIIHFLCHWLLTSILQQQILNFNVSLKTFFPSFPIHTVFVQINSPHVIKEVVSTLILTH